MDGMIIKLTRARRRALYCGALACLAVFFTIAPVAQGAEAVTEIRTCNISSPHPYSGWADLSWELVEGGITACRVNFSRLEVEDGYDFVILNSSYDEVSLTGSHPDGIWSEWINGTSFTLRLVSNSYNNDYGFDAVTYEVQVMQAWESFLLVAIPVGIVIVIAFVVFQRMWRREESNNEEMKPKTKNEKSPVKM